ncbi:hypothetical protein CPLU01_08095 [Colletotrichum plurivorum]|uniref:Uncharacterized protein n=1 Tax=Colletotrichum plurivorum TaxID=2175906 RepID=A0A8H6NE29_9PEZI|nr:hypothetical protein CPLU01_08095 [Colletotrichum plurivorum]
MRCLLFAGILPSYAGLYFTTGPRVRKHFARKLGPGAPCLDRGIDQRAPESKQDTRSRRRARPPSDPGAKTRQRLRDTAAAIGTPSLLTLATLFNLAEAMSRCWRRRCRLFAVVSHHPCVPHVPSRALARPPTRAAALATHEAYSSPLAAHHTVTLETGMCLLPTQRQRTRRGGGTMVHRMAGSAPFEIVVRRFGTPLELDSSEVAATLFPTQPPVRSFLACDAGAARHSALDGADGRRATGDGSSGTPAVFGRRWLDLGLR